MHPGGLCQWRKLLDLRWPVLVSRRLQLHLLNPGSGATGVKPSMKKHSSCNASVSANPKPISRGGYFSRVGTPHPRPVELRRVVFDPIFDLWIARSSHAGAVGLPL